MLIEISARWGDMDAYHHITNSRYFDYMTEARVIMFTPVVDFIKDLHFMVVATDCEFKRPIVYPNKVLIHPSLRDMGRTSFRLRYEFYTKEDTENIYAIGHTRMVCFNPIEGKPSRIPEKLKSVLLNINSTL